MQWQRRGDPFRPSGHIVMERLKQLRLLIIILLHTLLTSCETLYRFDNSQCSGFGKNRMFT